MSADALTLVMPATIAGLCWKAVAGLVLAGLSWCAEIVVTLVNVAG